MLAPRIVSLDAFADTLAACLIMRSDLNKVWRYSSMKLQVGQQAPEFNLPSHLDREVRLSDYRGRNVVLAFFPLAFTPT